MLYKNFSPSSRELKWLIIGRSKDTCSGDLVELPDTSAEIGNHSFCKRRGWCWKVGRHLLWLALLFSRQRFGSKWITLTLYTDYKMLNKSYRGLIPPDLITTGLNFSLTRLSRVIWVSISAQSIPGFGMLETDLLPNTGAQEHSYKSFSSRQNLKYYKERIEGQQKLQLRAPSCSNARASIFWKFNEMSFHQALS